MKMVKTIKTKQNWTKIRIEMFWELKIKVKLEWKRLKNKKRLKCEICWKIKVNWNEKSNETDETGIGGNSSFCEFKVKLKRY